MSSEKSESRNFKEKTTAEEVFQAVFCVVPKYLDSRIVESATQYVLMKHLATPLIVYNKQAEIEGGLVASWKISPDYKEYSFALKKDMKFSDGSKITSKDVVESLKIHLERGDGVHFNFNDIENISEIDEVNFSIKLRNPNKSFLNSASAPEFSVVHISDRKVPIGKQTFQISSGPYSMVSLNASSIELVKNIHYQGALNSSPSKVRIMSIEYPGVSDLIKNKSADYLDFSLPVHFYQLAKEADMKIFLPRVSMTHMIGINANQSNFVTKENRKYLQNIFSGENLKLDGLWAQWDRAKELYSPGGEGRVSSEKLASIWKDINAVSKPKNFPKKLTLLSSQGYPTPPRVIKILEENGIEVKHVNVERSELREQLINGKWDISLSANDFSATNVLENLRVTLSPDMPTFFLEKSSPIQNLFADASKALDKQDRARIIREIGEKLLENGNIIPFAYQHDVYYYSPKWDISKWSMLFPDVSIWKIQRASLAQ